MDTSGGLAGSAYCPICGREADQQFRRLGEAFCSESHAAEFVQEVRALAGAVRDEDTSKKGD